MVGPIGWAAAIPGTGRVVMVPASIDGTGQADVTVPLNALLASVPNDSAVEFPANRRYRIEGTLSLMNRRGVLIDGHGSVFFATTNGLKVAAPNCQPGDSGCRLPNRIRSQWSLMNVRDVRIQNVNVVGSDKHAGPNGVYNPALEAQHAFNLNGVTKVVLNHVSARNVWGDLVYVGPSHTRSGMTPSTYVTVSNSVFHDSSRMGWTVTTGSHVTFTDNQIYNVRRSLIDVEPGTTAGIVTFLTISNNRLGASRFCTFSNGGAAAVVHDVVIVDNHSIANGALKFCIYGHANARRQNYVIAGNVGRVGSHGPNEPMVSATYVDNLIVMWNSQDFWSQNAWPRRAGRNGTPQAPVTATCSTIHLGSNHFSRPAGMPEGIAKPC
jgi:hypothetical protein